MGSNCGSAYVFEKPIGGWSGALTENAKLTASDGTGGRQGFMPGGDSFGRSVSISGDTVVVGAPRDDHCAADANCGSAYILALNTPPVADAGPDQLVTVGPGDAAMVTLDGSGSSDPDGDPIIFTWTNSFGTVMGVMPTVPLPAGVHVITLTVDDGKGGSDTDTVEITVNQAPVADAGPDQLVTVALGVLPLLRVESQAAGAAVITVNTTDDELNSDGDCSLREAIQAANTDGAVDACTAGTGADTVVVPAGIYTLTLGTQLGIYSDLTLTGAGKDSTIVQAAASPGDASQRVFLISDASTSVDLSDLTIRHGKGFGGGGILNFGSLTLTNTDVTANIAEIGGGIWNRQKATLTMTNSSVTANTASREASANGGGINNFGGTLVLNNSTVSGNMAGGIGGGITNLISAVLTVTNSTIAGNQAEFGGGIMNEIGGGTVTVSNSTINGNIANRTGGGGGIVNNTGTIILINTIIANSTGSDCTRSVTSLGHNLDSDGTCALVATGDLSNTDPLLGPLQDNGGSTFTHALLPSSPAIDAGNPATPGSGGNACEAADQRGVARPHRAACDIGAFELETTGPDQLAHVQLDGSGSSDPDGDPLIFTWTGPFGTAMGAIRTVTLAPGVHTITLTVDDGKGGTDTDTVEITVNQAPVADAGPNQVIQVPVGGTADVTLDGSGSSDPDGDPLTFTWTNSFGTVMGVMPTVTLAPGVHSITLTIDDGNGGSDSDTVEITVNQPPTADAGTDQLVTVAPGDTAMVTLDGSGSSDPDGDPLTFTWTGPFGTVGGVSPTVTLPGGVHAITLTVDDGKGGVDTDTVIVTVRALKLSPSSLSFLFGKSHGASQPLSIRSVGGRVSYSIPRIASWLLTNPDRGASNGETDTIEVIVDPARSPGTYSTNMIIRGNGNIMARIPVTLVVPEAGVPGSPRLRLPENPAVDAADFIPHGRRGHAMAGQSVIAIFGEGFVADGEFRADTVPLPTTLGGVRVWFDGVPARLFLVTPGLIHAQLPMGLRGPTATLLITRDLQKAQSNPREIEIHDYSPGIFTLSQNGEGQGIVTFANSPDLAAPVGTVGDSRPATAGDLLTIYANGMGPVEPPIEDGHNSCEPDGVCLPDGSNVVLHETLTKPIIRIGGVQVPEENVLFSGASVASVAINEVVFQMPPGMPTGPDVPLTIEIGGVVSKGDVTMAIE